MKRLIIGLAILAVLLCLCLGITLIMERIHRPIADGFEQAAALAEAGAWSQALACAEEAAARWETYHNFTAAFADHTPMDEMDTLLNELRVYAHDRENPHFSATCTHLQFLARAIADAHRIDWWNLL